MAMRQDGSNGTHPAKPKRSSVYTAPGALASWQAVLAHDDFHGGRVTTRWVEEQFLASG